MIDQLQVIEEVIEAARDRQQLINKRRELRGNPNVNVKEFIPGLAEVIEEIHIADIRLEQALADLEGDKSR